MARVSLVCVSLESLREYNGFGGKLCLDFRFQVKMNSEGEKLPPEKTFVLHMLCRLRQEWCNAAEDLKADKARLFKTTGLRTFRELKEKTDEELLIIAETIIRDFHKFASPIAVFDRLLPHLLARGITSPTIKQFLVDEWNVGATEKAYILLNA